MDRPSCPFSTRAMLLCSGGLGPLDPRCPCLRPNVVPHGNQESRLQGQWESGGGGG